MTVQSVTPRRSSHGIGWLLWLALLPTASTQPRTSSAPAPPQAVFQELFVAVQSTRIFPDGKTFVDAVPKEPPERILAASRREPPRSDEALKGFVDAHFVLPAEVTSAAAEPDHESLLNHIDRLWNQLTRTTKTAPPDSSLLTLPYPYVVPGGRFREMYYWDSYLTMLGLMHSGGPARPRPPGGLRPLPASTETRIRFLDARCVGSASGFGSIPCRDA